MLKLKNITAIALSVALKYGCIEQHVIYESETITTDDQITLILDETAKEIFWLANNSTCVLGDDNSASYNWHYGTTTRTFRDVNGEPSVVFIAPGLRTHEISWELGDNMGMEEFTFRDVRLFPENLIYHNIEGGTEVAIYENSLSHGLGEITIDRTTGAATHNPNVVTKHGGTVTIIIEPESYSKRWWCIEHGL